MTSGQRLLDLVAHGEGRHAHTLEDGQHDAFGLSHQGGQQVVGCDLGVVALARQPHGGLEGLLGLDRPAIGIERHRHGQLTS